jgi:hypothetical protein
MERDLAVQMIEVAQSMTEPLDRLATLTEQIANEDERRDFRRRLAQIMGDIYPDLLTPIIRQYPDLDPHK